jgi:hypothetical protein
MRARQVDRMLHTYISVRHHIFTEADDYRQTFCDLIIDIDAYMLNPYPAMANVLLDQSSNPSSRHRRQPD